MSGPNMHILFLLCEHLPLGENSHILFSVVVKHLDHKNIIKQPDLQINIINIITTLAENAKQQVSPAIVGGISDLVKHLRKSMQYSAEQLSPGEGLNIQSAIENCILQLSYKVCLSSLWFCWLGSFLLHLQYFPSSNLCIIKRGEE